MYKIVSKIEDIMVVLVLVAFCCLVGQEIETFWPDQWAIAAAFLMCAFVGGSCCAYRTIYDKGMEAARSELHQSKKEQEPESEC